MESNGSSHSKTFTQLTIMAVLAFAVLCWSAALTTQATGSQPILPSSGCPSSQRLPSPSPQTPPTPPDRPA